MTGGTVTPDLATFRHLAARRRVIPVTTTLLADTLTPVGAYLTLAAGKPGTFLLESAEHGRSWSRWSFVGLPSRAILTEQDGRTRWIGRPPAGISADEDPLAVLGQALAYLHTEADPDSPPLTGGFIGYLGYDLVRRLEPAVPAMSADLAVPELAMMLCTELAALDHHEGTVTLIANAVNWDGSTDGVDQAYHHALRRLRAMENKLAQPVSLPAARYDALVPKVRRRTASADYQAQVAAAQEHIRAGDAFQIVLSQRFDMDTTASALDIYRVLRTTNPSPYMYLLNLPGGPGPEFSVVGSSPEALVTARDGQATIHPIAGTRPRGTDAAADAHHVQDLLNDDKERSEHLMLVDLGRNDLGRVCRPGSVVVTDFFAIEKYSHVMHIVSTVTGELAEDRTALDALWACFPAGTLSGAPKVSAMQIIAAMEPGARGPYGGVVGYLDFAGNADTAICIRSAVLTGGRAYVQAGAGVVADSVPAAEDTECRNKAAAVINAIGAASTLRPVPRGQ